MRTCKGWGFKNKVKIRAGFMHPIPVIFFFFILQRIASDVAVAVIVTVVIVAQ